MSLGDAADQVVKNILGEGLGQSIYYAVKMSFNYIFPLLLVYKPLNWFGQNVPYETS